MSIERRASASIFIKRKTIVSENVCCNEIVTSPPPFSSDVLIEHYRGKLLSEEVLHKLVDDFGHGLRTNVQGSCIGNNGML